MYTVMNLDLPSSRNNDVAAFVQYTHVIPIDDATYTAQQTLKYGHKRGYLVFKSPLKRVTDANI